MNVTPEVIERLRRIAGLERMSRKNGEEKKKEVDQNGNENDKVRVTSSGGNSSEGNGGLSPEVNSTENDMATPGSKQEKGEGALKRDMDVFRQILKEVIITRTLAIEKKVMGDVEGLKKQVFELEAQKERLQCDSERLQQTLNEISSKHEKQKTQLISCGTQVDMDLIQERPLSPEISKPIKPTSASGKSISFNKMQHLKIVNANQAQTVDPEQAVTYNIDENAVSLEKIKTADRTKTPESGLHCNDSGIGTTQNVPVAAENASKTLSDKDVTFEVSVLPPSQAQGITTGSVVTRDQQNELHVREIRTVENPQAPSAHRPPQALRVEVPRPEQERGNIYQQSPRVDMHQHAQTRGPPPLRPTVPSGNPPITGQHQVHLPRRSTETPPPYGTQYSSSRWLASQPQPPNQQGGHVEPRPHPFVNNTPIEQANPRSIATIPRGPPNVSLFHPPKRRRVENLSASDGPHMHAVSNNNSYVMHNFKVQMTPRALEAERAKKYVQISGPSPTNQAVYSTSPSNQLPGTYLNQGVPNSQPTVYPDQYPFRAKDNALERPAVGLSKGQLVERVFYPSKGSQSGGKEYHRDPKVMPAQHRRYTERAHATDQPAEPNSMVYVVQEYQVSRNHGNRAAPVQTIAPAPPAIPRNITCSPVQSPGISSTASPSGCRPGESNAGLVPRAASNPSDTPVVRIGQQPSYSRTPPKPTASIVVVQDGIVLSWNMRLDEATVTIENYELFACQDGAESTKPPIMWKKIGIVKALPLPMACTLTQFSSGNKYHFAVRAVDDQERAGPFSDPCTISLTN